MLQLQPSTVLKMDRALLAKATSSDDRPTPGYMYGEIAKMSLISHEACKELEDYLLARLKKGNASTKHKCLLIMKHVCRAGRADFKRDLQRQAEAVRDCLQYRGPPDPLKGEAPYQMVREAAKETLEAIYETAPPGGGVGPSPVAHRIQGFGSEPYYPSSSTSAGGPQAPYVAHDGTGIGGGLSSSLSGSGGLSSSITDMASSVVSAVTAKIAAAAAAGSSTAATSLTGGGGSYTGPNGGGGGYQGAMQGMGNPAFSDPRRRGEKGLLEKAGEMIGTVVSSVNSAAGVGVVVGGTGAAPQRVTFAAPPDRSGGFASAHPDNPSSSAAWSRASPTPGHTPYQSGGSISPVPTDNGGATGHTTDPLAPATSTRRPGGVGGVWGTAAAPAPSLVNSSAGQPAAVAAAPAVPMAVTTTTSVGTGGAGVVGRVGGAATDGSYERRLVLELCPPGGTRAVPPPEKLEAFLRAAGTLDVEVVGGCVLDQLGEESWQVRAKALAVAEALVKHADPSSHISSGGPRLPLAYKEFFIDNTGELEALVRPEGGKSKAAVRDRAVRLLRLLGSSSSTTAAHAPATTTARRAAAAAPVSAQASLLEFDDVEELPKPAPAAVAQAGVEASGASAAQSSLGGLFSDMTLKTTTPSGGGSTTSANPSTNGNGGDLIAGLAASPVTVPGNPLTMFDPLASSASASASASTKTVAVPTTTASAPATSSTDLLTDLLAASPPSMGRGGGMAMPPIPPQSALAPVAQQPPAVDLARMGQGMIPPLQPRTIIPSADEESSAFSFIGGGGGNGQGQPAMGGMRQSMHSMPGMMMGPPGMMPGGPMRGPGGPPVGRGNGGGAGEDEAAFSFVKDAMAKSR